MVEHFPCGASSPGPLSTLGRPLKFLIEVAEELAERETIMTEFGFKDMEFEEDRVEVVWLVVNPHQLHSSGVDPHRS